MKDDLILKKFKTESMYGTYNLLEESTIFGSKIMDIEDDISIKNNSVKYYQIFNNTDDQELLKKNGYQYYELNSFEETLFILNINNLKKDNHSIYKLQQSNIDNQLNTKWQIKINQKNILKEYLFAQIKNARTFKSIHYNNLSNKNINQSIYDYIEINLLDRYEFKYIELFVKYIDIKNNITNNNQVIKQYDPLFDNNLENVDYLVTNINIDKETNVQILPELKINYNQTMPSTENKFDYYFNIYFVKI